MSKEHIQRKSDEERADDQDQEYPPIKSGAAKRLGRYVLDWRSRRVLRWCSRYGGCCRWCQRCIPITCTGGTSKNLPIQLATAPRYQIIRILHLNDAKSKPIVTFIGIPCSPSKCGAYLVVRTFWKVAPKKGGRGRNRGNCNGRASFGSISVVMAHVTVSIGVGSFCERSSYSLAHGCQFHLVVDR